MTRNFSALILAAGKGVRMKSSLPKVLHPILGKPMVQYVVNKAKAVGAQKVSLIVGYGKDLLIEALKGQQLGFVEQAEQLGTGHAVQCFAKETQECPENLLVVCGDTPLLSRQTLETLVQTHFSHKNDLTLMTLDMENSGNYGRILRDTRGEVIAIRESKDCTEREKLVKEVNLGVYIFSGNKLFETLPLLTNSNKQKEFYLTDLIEIFSQKAWKVAAVKESDEQSTLGINSRSDLARVSEILQRQILLQHMDQGVTIVQPSQTSIEEGVEIGEETVINPGTVITNGSKIGANCRIGPHVLLNNATIGDDVSLMFCVVEKAEIPTGKVMEPFSHIFK